MKSLLYAFKQTLRPTWMNFIKIVSLALGICVSAALMCKVAWERSYDNFWIQADKLLYLEMIYNYIEDPDENDTDMQCCPGIAPEIEQKIASVETATRFRWPVNFDYLVNDKQFSLSTYGVDSLFFDVLKIKMIIGDNPKEILKNPGNVIISEKTAALIFPEKDPLGQQIRDEKEVYTVCGICEDLPKNSIFDNVQVIMGIDIPLIMDGNTAWFTFLRTYQKPDFEDLDKEINDLLTPKFEDWKEALGTEVTFQVKKLNEHSKYGNAERHIMLSGFAFALLLIAGLNFTLLTISSLTSRAKEVGVRKASGARTASILLLIILETVIYVLVATLLAAVIFWGFKPQLENIMGNYEDVFALGNLWAVALVLVLLIIIAGIIPAIIFSKIPVTQVFQRFTSNRSFGKRILLFIQFTASLFVICFMFITLRQYQTDLMRNLGYDKDKLLWMEVFNSTEIQKKALAAEICADSRVEAVNFNSNAIWMGHSGIGIASEPSSNNPIIARWLGTDSLFFKTHGIPILYGDPILTAEYDKSGYVVVNQAFIEKFEIIGNPIGQVVYRWNIPFTIAGVCRNFEYIYHGVQPLLFTLDDPLRTYQVLVVRVNEVTQDVIQTIQEKVKQFYQNSPVPDLHVCSNTILQKLESLRMFRDMVVIASIFLLLITIMGILGYVSLETRRRTKEVAIRKIHGSTSIAIIWKISRELLIIALLASPLSIAGAYIFGIRWQQEFVVKTELTWTLFASATLIVLLTITILTVLQTWRTANANPAKAIKAE